MACSKYTLTNTGSTIVNFSYRRCDDSFWDYQVELAQNETKNIWVIDGTYTVASSFRGSIVLANAGSFPPTSVTPTNTPTQTPTPTNTTTPTNTASNTPTPSVTATGTGTPTPTPTNTGTGTQTPTPTNTATQTPTPTNTGTQTPTPTNTGTQTPTPTNTGTGSTPTPTPTNTGTPTQTVTPTNTGTPTPTQTLTQTPTNTGTPTPTANNTFTVYSGLTSDAACGQYFSTVVVYGNNSQFDLSSQFSNISTFPPSISMTGFIQNNGFVFELDSNGFVLGFGTLCSTLTPTPTNSSTPTVTPTNTETPTVTPTNSSTPTVTPTNSSTPTVTPTNTETPTQTVTPTNTGTPTPTVTSTNTPSPTPTFGYYTYSLGTGATANDACVDFSGSPNTIYGTVAGGPGPNAGEFLYTTPGNPPTNPVANGYYSNGTAVFIVSGGLGQITSVDPNGCL
jgi:hypothetical protein